MHEAPPELHIPLQKVISTLLAPLPQHHANVGDGAQQ
jgi:hypothetical protein